VRPRGLPLRIQFLHLDQVCVEDFISNLVFIVFYSFFSDGLEGGEGKGWLRNCFQMVLLKEEGRGFLYAKNKGGNRGRHPGLAIYRGIDVVPGQFRNLFLTTLDFINEGSNQ